jgi:hypothetical protein
MPAPNLPHIAEFLKDRPLGASTREVARFLETTEESAHQSLDRMFARGQVLKGLGDRLDAPWTLAKGEITPPIFKAVETLSAMQELMRGGK